MGMRKFFEKVESFREKSVNPVERLIEIAFVVAPNPGTIIHYGKPPSDTAAVRRAQANNLWLSWTTMCLCE
jgi:hypothetical protein